MAYTINFYDEPQLLAIKVNNIRTYAFDPISLLFPSVIPAKAGIQGLTTHSGFLFSQE